MCGTLIAGGAFPQWISYTLLPFGCCVGMAVAQVAFYSVMMVKRIYGWVILFLYSDGHGGPRKWCEREARFYIKTIIFSSWTFLMVFQSTIQSGIMDLLLGHGAWVCEWYGVCTSSFTFLPVIYLLVNFSMVTRPLCLGAPDFSLLKWCRPKNIWLWWEKKYSSLFKTFSGGGENSQRTH